MKNISEDDNLSQVVSKCSKQSKQNLLQFFQELRKPEKKQQSSEELVKLQNIFLRFAIHFPVTKARQVSKDERNKRDLSKTEYNYGQIAFNTIYSIIQSIKKIRQLTNHQIFYDLGSGSGKVLFSAGLCYPFQKCIGIQYLTSLYQASCSLYEKIQENQEEIENKVNQIIEQGYQFPKLQLLNDDFKNLDWTEANIIFVSSTCYSSELMLQIEKRSQNLAKGTIMITLTKKLQQKQKMWKIVDKLEGDTSWGPCNIFIQIKQV